MARTQTRKSVSLNKAVYKLMNEHCQSENKSMSEFAEELILSKIGTIGQVREWEKHRKTFGLSYKPLEL